MQSVAASVVLDDLYRLIGWDVDQADAREKQDARSALSQALQELWDAWWWQVLMVTEKVQFAPSLPAVGAWRIGGTTYYSPADDWYYLALRWILEDPVVDGETNVLRGWAKWQEQSAATAWQAQAYDVGDQVTWGGSLWQWYDGTESGVASLATDVPGTAAGWLGVPDWRPPVPYHNNLPPYEPRSPRGKLRSVSVEDPRTTAGPREFQFAPTADGYIVLGLTVGQAWVSARRVTPVVTGDDFDATASYEATAAEDLVFDS